MARHGRQHIEQHESDGNAVVASAIDLVKTYGADDAQVRALDHLSVDFARGEMTAIMGPSGSGKSTLMHCMAGLDQPTSGKVMVEGLEVSSMNQRQLTRFRREQIGFIFQSFNLVPTLSAEENILLPLQIAKKPIDRAWFDKVVSVVGLQQRLSHRPSQLSGGQQQRVALARALVVEPGVLLFDEPLSNLDAKLRVSMRTEIRRIQQEVGITAIYVTHDQSEAMALSDQIIIMNKGVVAQIGTPQEIYFHPVSEFVADFIGEANFLRGKVLALEGNTATLAIEGETAHVEATRPVSVGEEVTMVLRPESATLTEDRGLPCKVEVSCFMGSYQNYHVRVGETLVKLTEYNPKNKRIFAQGENCFVHFDANATHIL